MKRMHPKTSSPSATSNVAQLPAFRDVDVLVVGGGPAGVSAAFAAARMGANTLVVEQFNCLGGIATAGGHGHTCLYNSWGDTTRIVGGVTEEIARRVVKAGFGEYHDNGNCDFEIEGMKLVLEQMAEECSCKLLYHTFGAEAVVEDGRIVGVVVQNKSGRQIIRARRVIDCTGDGDTASSAGCEFRKGDEETGHCQPMTLMFTVGGVDWSKVKAWRTDYKMKHVWEKAQKDGIMRPFQNQIMGFWWTPTRPDQVGINFTHINFADATRTEDLTAATLEGRKQAYECIDVFRKVVPGMEQCYMVSTPNTVGTRESRRIVGEYVMTREDVVSCRPFADAIGYGSFFIDIHGTTGPGMDRKEWRPPKGFHYQIPYRILVPLGADNLLVAGRCVSCDHEALGSLRVMPQCGVMGQAAGVAAALSLRGDVTPRNIDVNALQAELRKQDCILDENDIAKANAASRH